MNDDARSRIDKMESDIREMFAVYGALYTGVRQVVEDIIAQVKPRITDPPSEHDAEMLVIARRLTDLVVAVADKIEKTTHDGSRADPQ